MSALFQVSRILLGSALALLMCIATSAQAGPVRGYDVGCKTGDCAATECATGDCATSQCPTCGCATGGCATAGFASAECGGDATRCGMPAPQYPVPFATPRPTVPTHFTYPPMMPHNSLPHYRNVYSYRHGQGLSRTTVHWHSQPLMSGLRWMHHVIELPR